LALVYFLVIITFLRTPKASYWLDDDTYGETKYFHFKADNDDWAESLDIDSAVALPREPSYRLAILELDEFGDFYQSQKHPGHPHDYQLICATQMLKEAGQRDGKPLLFFLFVHGWRHNASPNDDNLKAFKQLLGHLANSESISKRFTVCGVYVGWRGASIEDYGWMTWPLDMLSFWNRKSVAERIASTSTSAAIFGLTEVARHAAPPSSSDPSSIVLAGHSLGAGILINSVSQALTYEFTRTQSQSANQDTSQVTLESPANLILLLNPAVESVYLRQLRVSIRPENRENLYPWIISLTSETDKVTKRFFPLAHAWPFAGSEREGPYLEIDWSDYSEKISKGEFVPVKVPVPQSEYARHTPGHNAYMRDLHLAVEKHTAEQLQELRESGEEFENVIHYNVQHGKQEYFLLNSREGEPLYGFFKNVRAVQAIHPLFWVATVDKRLMDGHALPFHDKLHRDNFVGMIMAVMQDSRVMYAEQRSMVKLKAPLTIP
jgi:hypothetical protein